MRRRATRRTSALLGGLLGAAVLMLGAPAHATAGDATISHVQTTGDKLQVLVDVPADANVDLGSVAAHLDGAPLTATASPAGTAHTVDRTAILAIDSSDSMAAHGRFAAAKQAALTYLQTVPADVQVGIVTFGGRVDVALPPTTDRAQAESVVNGLALSKGTPLYDGLEAALTASGSEGQRSVLLLSDGADTGSTASVDQVASDIASAHALVDAISLDQRGSALAALHRIVQAGSGQLLQSSGQALSSTFRQEADVLARQVLVTAPLPAGFAKSQGTVDVTLHSDHGTLDASALVPIDAAPAPTTTHLAAPAPAGGSGTPQWLLYAGIAVFGVGLIAAAVLLVPGKPAPMTITERLNEYTSQSTYADKTAAAAKPASEPVLEQAKAAAAGILERNEDLDRRLTQRLTAAGSSLKPSEWLLLHVGIVIASALVGALLGHGSIWIALLLAVVGAVLPMVYLRWKAGRRRKAFNNALPETLQLLSGALSAGLSFNQAVDTVSREGPEPIAAEFKRVLIEARIGVSVEDAFDGVAERFASKDFAWVVMAIRIQRRVGGNLAELLTTVAGTMRERAYLRRQVNALAAEGKLSAVILSILPPGVGGFVALTNPSYMTPLFHTGIGLVILIGGVGWLAVGIFWMSRMVRVEI